MPQISTSLPTEAISELHKIAKNSNNSFSKVVSNMITLGLEIHKKQNEIGSKTPTEKVNNLESRHSEYLLRLLNICSEILRKSYGNKSTFDANNAEDILGEIKENTKKYIIEYSGK